MTRAQGRKYFMIVTDGQRRARKESNMSNVAHKKNLATNRGESKGQIRIQLTRENNQQYCRNQNTSLGDNCKPEWTRFSSGVETG